MQKQPTLFDPLITNVITHKTDIKNLDTITIYLNSFNEVYFKSSDIIPYITEVININLDAAHLILPSHKLLYDVKSNEINTKTTNDEFILLIKEEGILNILYRYQHLTKIQELLDFISIILPLSRLESLKKSHIKETFTNDLQRLYSLLKLHSEEITYYKDQVSELEANLKTKKDDHEKIEYYETLISPKNLITSTSIGKDYGISAKTLHDILHKLKILYRSQNSGWELNQHISHLGYSKKKNIRLKDGKIKTRSMWTEYGRKFVCSILESNGFKVRQDNSDIVDKLLNR